MSLSIAQSLIAGSLAETQPELPSVEREFPANDIAGLTRRLVKRDEAAFREFHARYFNRLYQFLLVVARGQEDDAQEALQETLVRLVRFAREFKDEETFWCWLKAVGRNAARDGGRRRLRYLALLRNFALRRSRGESESPLSEEHRLGAILTECLSELSTKDRRLVEGKYLEGATIKELSELTSMTEKAVESRLGRLRSQLRSELLSKLNEP